MLRSTVRLSGFLSCERHPVISFLGSFLSKQLVPNFVNSFCKSLILFGV